MKMITRVSFFVCLLCVALVNAKSNRIVGGDNAHPGQFKYQILLQDNEFKTCGAAIIADQYVLTAAHCVVDSYGIFYASKYYVVADSIDMHSKQGVRIEVEKIYVPNIYRPMEKRNDIAVLKLRRGLGLGSNPNLQKIDLPSSRESSYVGHTAIMSGYGLNYVAIRNNPISGLREEYNGYTDGKLKYVMTNILSNEECDRQRKKVRIDENQICGQAVQREGQPTGVCTGDSGGPLVSGNIIIGVASVGPFGCREDKYSAIYTRVSSFIGFIGKAMENTDTSSMMTREIYSSESSSGSKGHGKLKWPFFCN